MAKVSVVDNNYMIHNTIATDTPTAGYRSSS